MSGTDAGQGIFLDDAKSRANHRKPVAIRKQTGFGRRSVVPQVFHPERGIQAIGHLTRGKRDESRQRHRQQSD
jgi:hypothetical protein